MGVLIAGAASTQNGDNAASGGKSVSIQRVDRAPVIDGVLDDAVWAEAMPITDLHQINPVEYAEPSERTEIRLLYDDDALYVSARLFDRRPDEITAQVLRQGEGLNNEDRFAIIIDPYLDRRSGYRFQVNPNGVRWDGLYSDTSNIESDWEGIWQGAATRDEQGWIAEIAIPFKTLSFDPSNDAWGINFERTIQRNDETLGWVSRNRQLNPGVAGTVVGFNDLQQGRGLDVVPSVSATGIKVYGVGGTTTTDVEPSLDVFYKITPLLSGALTLNTDFSATEIDDRQVNLTRFGLFFPEKRDFFLQDADIFEFGRIGGGGNGFGGGGGGGGGFGGGGGDQNGRPFFSRRIGLSTTGQPVDIDVGAKLSGRAGRFNIGALAIAQDSFGTVEADEILVGRVAANILGESNVGVIFTDGDPQSNLDSSTVGTDFNYRNTRLPGGRVLEANAWYQQTDTEGVTDNDEAFGWGISSPNNTGWRGGIEGKQIEANFDPAVGFVNEVGIKNWSSNLAYRHRFGDRRIRAVNGSIEASRTDRLDTGDLDRKQLQLGFNIETASQDRMFVNISENTENIPVDFAIYRPSDGSGNVVIPAGSYTWRSGFLGMRSGNQRKISAFIGMGTGEYYDGESTNINSNVQWRPSASLRLSVGYGFRDVDLPGGNFQVRQAEVSAQYVFSS
ncbi:MAG: sugar-binding protein, partial [Gammaproteobacteria bacterium]|nr:sugar-binding protein [Gammaproteobacteria bacterium]